MSVEAVQAVWRHAEASGGDLNVLLALANRADEHGVCWPEVEELVRKSRLKRRGVQYALRRLEASGQLVTLEDGEGGRGRAPLRWIRLPGLDGDTKGAIRRRRKGAIRDEKGRNPQHEKGAIRDAAHIGAPEDTAGKSVETSGNRQARAGARVARRPVTEIEWALAAAVLDAFNRLAGTGYTLAAHYTPIVGRIREHPELGTADHAGIVEEALRRPWWEGAPGPAVVYGNAAQFERCLEAWRAARRAPADPQDAYRTWPAEHMPEHDAADVATVLGWLASRGEPWTVEAVLAELPELERRRRGEEP